jgi:hypothetical protein
VTAFILLLFTGIVWASHAPDPEVNIPYQGTLYDGSTAASGDYAFTFEIYDAETLGNQLHIEQPLLTVSSGLFAHVIGEDGDLFQSELRGEELWLQVSVEGASLGARQRVFPTPVAQTAQTAHSLTLTTDRTLPWVGWRDMIHMDTSGGHGAISLGDMFFGLHTNKSFYWADQSTQTYAMQLDTTNNTLTVANVTATNLTTTNANVNNISTRSGGTVAVNNTLDVNGLTVTDRLRVGQSGDGFGMIQHGTMGTCGGANVGSGAAVNFSPVYSSIPRVFLTVGESDNSGCTSVRLWGMSNTGFTVQPYVGGTLQACDCIHWMAIGQ